MPRPENMTPAQLANLEKGRFRKGEVSNPKGRPRNRAKEDLRKNKSLSREAMRRLDGLSKDEVDTYERVSMALPLSDLKALLKDPNIPLFFATYIKSAIECYERGDTRVMDRLRTLQFGEPPKSLDVTTAGHPLRRSPSEMTEEEIMAEMEEIKKRMER